jgi:exopolysaccharide biosynthesis WecB/TagA/CpsF family protein
MIADGKREVLGVLVDVVDYESAVHQILAAAEESRGFAVTALAVHGLTCASDDPVLRAIVNDLDLVTPDGQPVRWALNQLRHAGMSDRVYGPELMLAVLAECARRGLPVYFYGSSSDVLRGLTSKLVARCPGLKIVGADPSLFRRVMQDDLQGIATRIESSGAKVLFVGLGCPRQEVFVHQIRQYLPMPAIAVGAAFDFHSGHLSQAPAWIQQHGLEWAYRLAQEPTRLWRRYLVTNSKFLVRWARQASGQAPKTASRKPGLAESIPA